MAYVLWSQDIFSKGELSPFMYGRATVTEYGNGLKKAQNVLTYPTGAAGKRFGTLYQATLTGLTDANELFFQTFQYLNQCVYQLVFVPNAIYIYLEGILVATVVTTLDAHTVYNLNYTVLGPRFRVAGIDFKPFDLQRSANAITTDITAIDVDSDVFTILTPVVAGQVMPFTIANASNPLPATNPILKAEVVYFYYSFTTTTIKIYTNSRDAKFDENALDILDSAVVQPTNVITPLNTWTFTNPTFKNLPTFDFNNEVVSYTALTFTPSAVSGPAVTITVAGPYTLLTSAYIGGRFTGNGGTARITAVASTTSFTVATLEPFDNLDPILGSLAFLAEPAWSDVRGWPQVCSSYQNRCLFANTTSLPNGFWASAVNDYFDFNDLAHDDDDAISWYPTSNDMNYIRFIVPYRSVTVHTNTGIYSSPLSDVSAITPDNFSLQLQDSTPADVLQPQAIDNQVLVLSGNDAHQMLWDGINNAYTSDIVSVINEQLIRSPVDETPFADLHRAGSRYVFIINEIGTMAVFQTLLSQNVSGFTPQILEQSYGLAGFLQAASSADGRCWFVTQRELATEQTPIVLTGIGITGTTLQGVLDSLFNAANLATPPIIPTAVMFTTTGTLPTSDPQIETGVYYWAVPEDDEINFSVYSSQEDAKTQTNPFTFTNLGSNSNVISWKLVNNFIMEELTQETFLDCAIRYSDVATDTVATGALFNAQTVKMAGTDITPNGDLYGFEAFGMNDEIVFTAHGENVDVKFAYIGYPINTIIEPMPLTIANGPSAKNTTLTRPKHVRTVRFMFNNTIGGTINGVPIALEPFNQVPIGVPPHPARGIFEMSVMKGWDDFNNPTYTIEHSDPFNIQLLGVYYALDI